MKVLLIQPPSVDPLTDQIFLFEPLAMEYLGPGLKQDGHKVDLLDARIDPDYEGTYLRFQPDVIGLTGFISFWTPWHAGSNEIIQSSSRQVQVTAS
jgi:hypothetical protein